MKGCREASADLYLLFLAEALAKALVEALAEALDEVLDEVLAEVLAGAGRHLAKTVFDTFI